MPKAGRIPAIEWLRAVVQETSDFSELTRVAESLPESTLALREFAADVTARIVEVVQSVMSDGEGAEEYLARLCSDLAVRLSDLGRRQEALTAAEEAVALYRQLAATRPDALKRQIAKALTADPTLADELQLLLAADARPLVAQDQDVGAGGKAIQNAGNNNTNSIS